MLYNTKVMLFVINATCPGLLAKSKMFAFSKDFFHNSQDVPFDLERWQIFLLFTGKL